VIGIVSALLGRPIRPGIAITGEVALHGEIGAVGGIPHKLRAASRAGRKRVLIPAENAKETTQLPAELLAQLEIRPVRMIQEALQYALEPGVELPQPAETPAGMGM
jgi:ATP-dependent Lon protease